MQKVAASRAFQRILPIPPLHASCDLPITNGRQIHHTNHIGLAILRQRQNPLAKYLETGADGSDLVLGPHGRRGLFLALESGAGALELRHVWTVRPRTSSRSV